MLKDLLTVLVICYDPYEDAIDLSAFFLDKYWKERSLDVYYVTSEKDVKNMTVIKTHGDLTYGGRLKAGLERINTPYVLLLLDDYLISKPIDENKIVENIQFMKNNNAHFCELFTMFNKPRGKKVAKNIKLISKKRRYRLNLQPAIFSKKLLNDLASSNPRNAWQAELNMMNQSFERYNAFFAMNKSFSIINYIDKGNVTRKARNFLIKHNVWQDCRSVMNRRQTFKKWFVTQFKFLSIFVPKHLQNKMKGKDNIYRA